LLFLLPVDDLGASHTSTFEPNEAVTLSSELTAAGSRCDFREGMPVTTSKNKITRFSASDRQPVRMRFTKKILVRFNGGSFSFLMKREYREISRMCS
ncbi:hypothetical protein K16_14465, partial [Klebsiella pneumoniae]